MQWNAAGPQSTHRRPLSAKRLGMISHPPPTIECAQSVNNSCGGSACYTAMKCIVLFQNCVLRSQSLQYVLVYNFTNMHAMSHRSDFLACCSRVNMKESAFCLTIMLLSALCQVVLPSIQIPTAMLDSKSLETSLLEVVITSKN